MLGLRIAEQLLSLLAMLSFGWALRWLFITPGRPPLGVWALTVATAGAYVLFSIYLWANPRAEVSAGLALLGFSLSILLFWWTVKTIRTAPLGVAYAGRQSPQVQSQGPYALIRHPFYGSYILFWAATAVGVGGWQWAVALGFFLWYGGLARGEEQSLRASPIGRDYAAYQERTGMLLPTWNSFSRTR